MKRLLASLFVCSLALAQQPVTLNHDRPARPKEVGAYSISNSFEVGYRFADVHGDQDLYRASVNYGEGMRLFDGQIRVHSLDGRGRLLDEFSLRTFGAPADPYQAHVVRAEKHRLYRYDMQLRTIRYHNRLLTLWRGEHGLRSERSLQTHDFTLRPDSEFEVLIGFDRNRRTGPGFASEGIADRFGGFDARNFLRYRTDLQQQNNQFRLGFSARFLGLALTAVQALDFYEEDSDFQDASQLPSVATNIQPVTAFDRSEPFRGRTPVTTVALRTGTERRIGFNARYVYSGGARNSTLLENLSVRDPASSAATIRESFVVGDAHRRQSSGDFTVVLLPTERWTITNTTAYHNTRMDGRASFLEIGLFRNEFLRFEHLGIRRFANASEANFRPVKQVSVYGAYRSSTRRIRTSNALRFGDFGFESELRATDNTVRSGAAGVRWLPFSGFRASLDFEAGRADQPLAPTSDRRFHNQSARVRWRGKAVSISGFFRNRANDNPTELLAYSSKSRAHGVNASWTDPASSVVLNAGYSFLGLDVSAGILNLFDLGGEAPERARSVYVSRIHNVNFAIRAALLERLTLDAGYALTRDAGDGRLSAIHVVDSRFSRNGANVFSSLPVTYHSPQARISVFLRKNLSWNFGWQFYHYAERLGALHGYRAHVGFSSLRIGL